MFRVNALLRTDGYKIGHVFMLAPGTTRLYGTWIPRTLKYAPPGVDKIVSFGEEMTWQWIHDEFEENFFNLSKQEAVYDVAKDFSAYLGLPYNANHFEKLWDLGYLPLRVQALPEGIETPANVPHMTFINTVDGFAWLTLYLETIVSSLAWKPSTSATIALRYRRNTTEWVMKTDPDNAFLIDYMNHDFSARGLSPWDMISSGLGHATSHLGSDTLPVIPAARYFYNENKEFVAVGSVNASEHSVSTTKIFTVGEKQMNIDWLREISEGIFSMVCDTFSTWQFIDYLKDPEIQELVVNRKGKLVVRPDSGDPVDILCGLNSNPKHTGTVGFPYEQCSDDYKKNYTEAEYLGVIELLWNIFGGTVNAQGYKVLPPFIGAIYGDSINLERQVAIYERLAAKGFAATNVVLGVGSFTYQFNTRDTFGFAAKGAWFEVEEKTEQAGENVWTNKVGYNIYKDPITDDGSKKSLKGFQFVQKNSEGVITVTSEVTEEVAFSNANMLETIYLNGVRTRNTKFTEIRNRLKQL